MKLVHDTPRANPMMSIEREHEIQKMAKELAVGLPIGEEAARAIVSQIGHDALALATFGSFIEALQEAIEDSVATLAFGSHAESPTDTVRRLLIERLSALSQQTNHLIGQLPLGGGNNQLRAGASQTDEAPLKRRTNHTSESEI